MNLNLYVARRESRLTQKELAKAIGVHPQSYHLKETGKSDFTITEAKIIAKKLNKTLDEIFWEEH